MSLTAEALFRTHFLPRYPEDARSDLARARAVDANPANNPAILAHLGEAADIFAQMAPQALGAPSLALDFTDASVHRLSAELDAARRDALVVRGELSDLVIHGAAYVGACIVKNHDGVWSVRRPLWESVVRLRSRAGEAQLPVFHWWLRSLADEATATLADRYRAYVEVANAPPETLAPIAPEDRRLPKLEKVRYDTLFKYLRANLPELRFLGDDFPSPERLDELAFKSLSFLLVGGGRMLIIHGPNANGLHAFWLGREGFEKSAFWPCDAFPEPILRKKGDKLEVILSRDGRTPSSFELLWWGP
jgi:hypothetical protein